MVKELGTKEIVIEGLKVVILQLIDHLLNRKDHMVLWQAAGKF
ncbi:hypothetical protein RDI91_01525 [Streptococcus ruminantium]|uniref:Uncharacterized protein n=1 Tax=Streptococcus ruminantium TaxID=1917441 RepID=A0ABU1B2J6_9STRE|nr:hypothetical protein [Streptococcus ruminantium]MDQ8759302.1 hypothetical protein [Streptococcus ruminantium]MDQ8765879.1 hypothetical protein [Streptococcus ruminantium]MDQ8768367.1 hypothetical protein [Streptococcus ruminantium]MDQ8774862.1 hypothetical protein [Streptococcus ruminantium]MDQ8793313.1 hypothetical protein [Streptococcus ruminantium]